MDIFDGLHPQCEDSIDVEKSDSSEDSDMEVIEQLIEPAEADLARLIVDIAESEQVTDAQKTLQCSPLLSCLCPRWFLFLTRSVESPRRFLFLGRFLVWGQFLFLGQGFTLTILRVWLCLHGDLAGVLAHLDGA